MNKNSFKKPKLVVRKWINNLSRFELLYIMLTPIYLIPTYFKNFSFIYLSYNYVLPFFSLGLFIFVFFRIKKKDLLGLIIVFYLSLFISTCINHGEIIESLITMFNAIAYCSLTQYVFERYDYKKHLYYVTFVLQLLVFLNMISIILYPNGLYLIYGYNKGYFNPAYLLGHRNNAIEYFIPLIGTAILTDMVNDKKISINTIIVISISLLTSILSWSVNSLLCIVFIILCVILTFFIHKMRIMNVLIMFSTSVFISILLIVFQIQNKYSYFINYYLRRDVSLSSRSDIWTRSIDSIRKSPIFGYGIEPQSVIYSKIGHMSSCHNYFLDYLYQGGIIMMAIVIIIVFCLSKKYKRLSAQDRTKVSIVFGSYMILWIATPIHRDSLFIMFSYFIISSNLCRTKQEGGYLT